MHVQTAIYQAILAHVQGTLRTKTVHSEVLWALSPGHNVRLVIVTGLPGRPYLASFQISEAIKRFGVSDTTQVLLVIRVSPPSFTSNEFNTKAGLVVKGDLVPLSSLEQYTDWKLVQKVDVGFLRTKKDSPLLGSITSSTPNL